MVARTERIKSCANKKSNIGKSEFRCLGRKDAARVLQAEVTTV